MNSVKLSSPKKVFRKRFNSSAYFARRKFLYRMLGGVCSNCKVEQKQVDDVYRGKKMRMSNLQIHHVFYPFGSPRPGYWGTCSEDDFWDIFFPEIMESCMLLCIACHKKVHGIR